MMNKYLTIFGSHSQYVEPEVKPNVSYCMQEDEVHYSPHTWADEYLTFVAKEDGTFQLSTNAVSYSLDNGETWTELAAATASPTVTAGNKIMWKGELTPSSDNGIGTFSATGNFDVQGNAMSLLYGNNYKGQTDLTGKYYVFRYLFSGNTNIISTENLILPATTLEYRCYENMFRGCTNLTVAPELPAMTLTYRCYAEMFYECTSLTTAPELPATALANECYYKMFSFCESLNYIKCLALDDNETNVEDWVRDVASSGTFVKNVDAIWERGWSGIPTGWTIETATA